LKLYKNFAKSLIFTEATMADVQGFLFQEGGETFEIYIESKSTPEVLSPIVEDEDDPGGMGITDDVMIRMQQARSMIRGYTLYALSAFKDFGAAEIEEVSLKFGLKISGKAGIPYITEGSADCNLEVSVKCKLPAKQEPEAS
jgi:hypothetical protein